MKNSEESIKIALIIILLIFQAMFFFNKYFYTKANKELSSRNSYSTFYFDVNELIDANRIPVFTFHRIVTDEVKEKTFPKNQWAQAVSNFEDEVKYLYDNNYKTLSLDEFYCWYRGDCEYPVKTVVLTFDDGNWDDYYLAMPILKKYNLKATTFVVGHRTLEEDTTEYDPNERRFITRDIINKTSIEYPNLKYESHSYNFHDVDSKENPIVLKMTKQEIYDDFKNNEKFGFKYIAYPYGVYTKDVISAAKEYGYNLGFAFRNPAYATRKSPQYEIPRIKLNGESSVETLKKWLYN